MCGTSISCSCTVSARQRCCIHCIPLSPCLAALLVLLLCGAKLVQNVRIRLIPLMLGTRLWPGHMQGYMGSPDCGQVTCWPYRYGDTSSHIDL